MYYQKTYKVRGEDVDDFMVMQNFAYHSYASSILKVFLFEKGYSKHKLNALKIGLREYNEKLTYRKDLMFTQDFFVNLEFIDVTPNNGQVSIKNRFFNAKNELCATAITQLCWFNNDSLGLITPPKKIIKHFLTQEPRVNLC